MSGGGQFLALGWVSEVNKFFKVCYNIKQLKLGFTLAEVLITLGIIGVIAALTIPTLIMNYRKIVVENQLKSTYSIISQAIKLAEVENGVGFEINSSSIGDYNDVNGYSFEHSEYVFDTYFRKYFKILNAYSKSDTQTFFSYRQYNGHNMIYPSKSKCYKLVNGIGICYTANGNDDMGYFYIYLNPNKKVKIAGRDVFSLEFKRVNGTFKLYQMIDDVYKDSERQKYIDGCVSSNTFPVSYYTGLMVCSFLIWHNNFKIPDDYPINF